MAALTSFSDKEVGGGYSSSGNEGGGEYGWRRRIWMEEENMDGGAPARLSPREMKVQCLWNPEFWRPFHTGRLERPVLQAAVSSQLQILGKGP